MRQDGNWLKEIDHLHFHPEDAVAIADANAALPTTLAGHYPAGGHFFVDVNIYKSTALTSGTFSVYVWDEGSGHSLLFCTQSINTSTTCIYRVEIGGRPFWIASAAVAAFSYTLI